MANTKIKFLCQVFNFRWNQDGSGSIVGIDRWFFLFSIEIMDREGDQNSEETDCSVCHKVGKNQRCSKCQRVWYCSKECQKKDWSSHKKTCKNKELKGDGFLAESKDADSTDKFKAGTMYGNCNFCNHRGALKSCGACKERHYCSKDCQKSDWSTHKFKCNKSDTKESGGENSGPKSKQKIDSSIYGKNQDKKGPKDVTSQFNIPPGLEGIIRVMQCNPGDFAEKNDAVNVTRDAWKRARYEVGRKFRNVVIHDTFATMPFEYDYHQRASVALLFMPRTHVYFPRHCMYIQVCKIVMFDICLLFVLFITRLLQGVGRLGL